MRNAADESASVLWGALDAWVDAGWLRRLDAAFARFVSTLDPAAGSEALVAIALLARCEGQGHACLELDPWPPEASASGLDAGLLRAVSTLVPANAEVVMRALRASRAVDDTGAARSVGTRGEACGDAPPLVLQGGRLYLRRYADFEQRIATAVAGRLAPDPAFNAQLARLWLDRLFPAAVAQPDWQKVACALAVRARFCVITGGPGTGKTFTVARLLALLFALTPDASRLRVALAAPTGKAATRLTASITHALNDLLPALGASVELATRLARLPPARTVHALLGASAERRRMRYHAGHHLDVDVLVLDEASMVHLELMADLLDALPPGARVIMLGDRDQLASVEAGAVLGDLCADAGRGRYDDATRAVLEHAAGVMLPADLRDPTPPALAQHVAVLRHSRRFDGAIGRLAAAINDGDPVAARAVLAAGGALAWRMRARTIDVARLAADAWRGWMHDVQRGPQTPDHDAWVLAMLRGFDAFRVLCAVRSGPVGAEALNVAIARALQPESAVQGRGAWYSGRPVMVTRNDSVLHLANGDVGLTLASPDGGLRVYFAQGDGVRGIAIARLSAVETAYAMTVHKSQGSEFGHVALVLPAAGHAARELVYTAVTRAREAFTLLTEREHAFDDGIVRVTRRYSGLTQALRAATRR